MSFLGAISAGKSQTGLRTLICGQEKMGKTTLAASMPTPLLIPMEMGYSGVDVHKTPMVNSYNEFLQVLNEITTTCQAGQFPYKTIIFDSATALERLIHEQVLLLDTNYKAGKGKTVTIDSAHGGYGRGHNMANNFFQEILRTLDSLAMYGGINVVFTCHVFAAKINDPVSGAYDSWDILLHSPMNQKAYGKRELITQWADLIGFLYEPVFVTTGEDGMTRGISQKKGRVLGVSRSTSYSAGNRFGMEGEIPIPPPPSIGWNAVAAELHAKANLDTYTR
jgi:hypothetical protein